jgi:hypothetical protein
MTVAEILHDIEHPPGVFDKPWLRETYGHRDYIVLPPAVLGTVDVAHWLAARGHGTVRPT